MLFSSWFLGLLQKYMHDSCHLLKNNRKGRKTFKFKILKNLCHKIILYLYIVLQYLYHNIISSHLLPFDIISYYLGISILSYVPFHAIFLNSEEEGIYFAAMDYECLRFSISKHYLLSHSFFHCKKQKLMISTEIHFWCDRYCCGNQFWLRQFEIYHQADHSMKISDHNSFYCSRKVFKDKLTFHSIQYIQIWIFPCPFVEEDQIIKCSSKQYHWLCCDLHWPVWLLTTKIGPFWAFKLVTSTEICFSFGIIYQNTANQNYKQKWEL